MSIKPMPEYVERMAIKVQAGRLYIPVSARVLWFRSDHPDWGIESTIDEINHEKLYAVFTATIVDSDGKIIAQGTKKEDAKGFGDYIEKAQCVPLSTKILTLSGWKFYDELVIGEPILAYDVENEKAEWVPLENVSKFKKAPVVRMRNGWGFDVVCTEEHTWAVKYNSTSGGKNYKYRKLVKTVDLNKGHRITTACPAPSGFSTVSESRAALMGWLMTDGRITSGGKKGTFGMIYQSKPETIKVIRELLKDVDHVEYEPTDVGERTFPSGRTYKTLPQVRWRIGANGIRRLLSEFGIDHIAEIDTVIPDMSFEARQAMLDAMMEADGSKKGNFGKKRRPEVMPTFSLLCSLQGVALGAIRWQPQPGYSDFPTYRLKKTCNTYITQVDTERAGECDVWCPTTKHGTWFARFDNGACTITGNTGAIGRALAFAGYGQLSPDDDMSGLEEGGVAARMVDTPQKDNRQPARQPQAQPVAPKPQQPKPQTSEPVKPPAKPDNGGGKFQRVAEMLDSDGKVIPVDSPEECPYPLVRDMLYEMNVIKLDPFGGILSSMWDFIQGETGKTFTNEQTYKWPAQEYCVKLLSTVAGKKGFGFSEEVVSMIEGFFQTITPTKGDQK